MRSIDELAKACAPVKSEAPGEEMKLDDSTLSKFLDQIADRVIEKLSNPQAGEASEQPEESETDQQDGEADQGEGGEADG